MVPQIMANSINCQAIHLLRTTENGLGGGVGIFLKKWTELQITERSTKPSHRVNLA